MRVEFASTACPAGPAGPARPARPARPSPIGLSLDGNRIQARRRRRRRDQLRRQIELMKMPKLTWPAWRDVSGSWQANSSHLLVWPSAQHQARSYKL